MAQQFDVHALARPLDEEALAERNLRCDGALGNHLKIIQPRTGYRAAIDPFLLAGCLPLTGSHFVVELGCGAGALMLGVLYHHHDLHMLGYEIQPDMIALARANLQMNGFAHRTQIIHADIVTQAVGNYRERLADTQNTSSSPWLSPCDWVVMNPPFGQSGTSSALTQKRESMHQKQEGDFFHWCRVAREILPHHGYLGFIHRADQLDYILSVLHHLDFGHIVLYPFWPTKDRPAKRIMIIARKNSRGQTRFLPGLILHQARGSFTQKVEAVLTGTLCLGTELQEFLP